MYELENIETTQIIENRFEFYEPFKSRRFKFFEQLMAGKLTS